jgi:hypothetical protein
MGALIAVVVVLWLLGIIQIPWLTLPRIPVFMVFGTTITLTRLLILALIIWLAMSLGSPFRQIVWAFVILWLLSVFGLISIGSMSTLIIIAIVVGLILSLVQRH